MGAAWQAGTHQPKATRPKVLRRWYSSTPATNCAKPPKKKPKPIASWAVSGSVRPLLAPWSRAVVRAKPNRPRGACTRGSSSRREDGAKGSVTAVRRRRRLTA